MFIFKKSKIVVDAFTWHPSIESYFKPAAAINFIPEWYKTIPSSYKSTNRYGISVDNPTIKRCDGFLHLFRKGFIIPLWSDLVLETKENGSWAYEWSDQEGIPIVDHQREQIANGLKHLTHIKITSPWLLKEKTGVDFYWAEPVWNNLESFNGVTTLPGIINFKHQGSSHINIFLPNENKRYEFKHNHPMAHLIPLSDKQVEVKTHLISIEEWKNMRYMDTHRFSFLNYYKNKVKLNNKKSSKCPFGFGK